MKIAGAYFRVSTSNQEKEATIDSQIAEVKERIKKDGNILGEKLMFVDNGWSGDVLARPALDAMRDAATKKLFEILYVWDRDRIARRYSYQELVLDELQDLGIEFIDLQSAPIRNPEDKILLGFKGLFAEYERVKISERMRRGKLYKVRNGILFGWNAPYGYRLVKGDTKKGINPHFEILDHEARVIRIIFEWLAVQGLTIRGVIKKLLELKIRPRRNKDGVWSTSTLARLLRDETYIGTTYYNRRLAVAPKNPKNNGKYKKVKKSSRVYKPKKDWIPLEVPSIIKKDLFDRTQKQLAVNNTFSIRNKKHDYLVAGIIYCLCGQKRTGGGTKDHIYYNCIDRILRFPLPRQCHLKGVHATVVDTVIWLKLVQLFTQPKLVKEQAEKWNKRKIVTLEVNQQNNQSALEELKKIEIQERRFMDAYGSGVISLQQLKDNLNELRLKKATLQNITKTQDTTAQQPRVDITKYDLDELCGKMTKLLIGLTFEKKQFLVRNILNRVITDGREATIRGYIPLQVAELEDQAQNINLRAQSRNCRIAKCRKIDAF